MLKQAFCTIALLSALLSTAAHTYSHIVPLKLKMADMGCMTDSAWHPDLKLFTMKTNEGLKPPRVMDELSFAGVPLVVSSLMIRGEKHTFRQNYDDVAHPNTRLLDHFENHLDDKAQYFGPALTLGLKLAGVEGRSSWPRLWASAAMAYSIEAILVNGLKYTVKEQRPDGSSHNAWPSGHTATSFAGATILHKEYGLTRSPWYSVAGYGVATATGVMRVLNNRHWVSDILAGAGVGIMSTELAYALSDMFFKEKGLLRNDLEFDTPRNSFLSLSIGVGLGTNALEFAPEDLTDDSRQGDFSTGQTMRVEFHPATTIDIEGCYFINDYVGVGGRLRARSMTATNWDDIKRQCLDAHGTMGAGLNGAGQTVACDYLTEIAASLGLYVNIPISDRLAFGAKMLAGRSKTQEMDTDLKQSGSDYSWPAFTLGGSTATNLGPGVSLTYHYKSGYAWKLFADYDFARRTYALTYDPYAPQRNGGAGLTASTAPYTFETTRNTFFVTLGGSFAITF